MRLLMSLLAIAAPALSSAPVYADLGDQLFKLLPDDGAERDEFGVSVAISGATTIAGASFDADNGHDSGSAYLFDTKTGDQLFKLLPDDGAAGDYFGFSVAVSDGTAIVGALRHSDNGQTSGSAYLFDAATGKQIFKLLPDDGSAGDNFGNSVGISGTIAIVGAFTDFDNGPRSGSAYLFNTTTGRQIAKILPSDAEEGDWFGASVAISGATAIVGAFGDGHGSGSAYLFDAATGQQIAKLLPDGAARVWFGVSVAISDDTAIVGARFDNDNGALSGSAYLFDTPTGKRIFKLLPDDGAADDWFGESVGISGATAIVGARFDDDNGDESGSAYLFDAATGRQIAKLLPKGGAAGDFFGWSVGISGVTAIVGSARDDDNGENSGSAYLFDADAPSRGDLNCDGSINAFDIEPFLLALFDPDEYAIRFPDCDINLADINADGSINAFDIEPFLDLLFP